MVSISPEMEIVWRNGSGVRYTGSSLSSSPAYESNRQTPITPGSGDEEEEIDNMEALKRNNIRYLHARRKTLPTLMNKYIVHPPETNKSRSRSPSARIRKKKKRQRTFNLDDDREQEKRRQRETEKFLQIYDDLHKIRDHYYNEYMAVLRKKVDQQHKDIKEKDMARETKRQEQIEEARLKSHQVTKRYQRHNVTHDDTFLQKIPRTELFKIVQLQDKLKRKGNLRYNSDVDEFWKAIRKNPAVFNYYLEKLNMDPGYQSLMRRRLASSQKAEEGDGSEGGSHPETDSFLDTGSSQPGDNWAVTQMYPTQHRGGIKSGRRGSVNTMARLAANDLDKRYPKMEMPEMYCFKMDLSRKLPDPLEMLQNAETQAKDHDRKKYMRQLHKMHQLALTHQVAANRILKKHEDELEMVFGGPAIDDVIDVDFAMGRVSTHPASGQKTDSQLQPLPPIVDFHSLTTVKAQEGDTPPASLPQSRQKYFEDSSEDEESSSLLAIEDTPNSLPLTLDEVKGNCRILEAKCSSLYWDNYMKAGKTMST